MKFSKDFDNYAREVLHIENPFREFYRTQDSTFKTNIDGSITVDMEKSREIYKETKTNREEWVKLRNRYIAERILRELGYEVLLTSSYFEDYPDAIPCDGATGQCLLDCRIKGCPCIDYCYLRLHQQYDPIRCEYAKVIKENKELKQKIEELKTQHTLFEK